MNKAKTLVGSALNGYEDDSGNKFVGELPPESRLAVTFAGVNGVVEVAANSTVRGGVVLRNDGNIVRIGTRCLVNANFDLYMGKAAESS